jgi:hypothetical protein
VLREVLGIRKQAELGPAERERRRAIGKRLAQRLGRRRGTNQGGKPQAPSPAQI